MKKMKKMKKNKEKEKKNQKEYKEFDNDDEDQDERMKKDTIKNERIKSCLIKQVTDVEIKSRVEVDNLHNIFDIYTNYLQVSIGSFKDHINSIISDYNEQEIEIYKPIYQRLSNSIINSKQGKHQFPFKKSGWFTDYEFICSIKWIVVPGYDHRNVDAQFYIIYTIIKHKIGLFDLNTKEILKKSGVALKEIFISEK